jgi:hypothetical protein
LSRRFVKFLLLVSMPVCREGNVIDMKGLRESWHLRRSEVPANGCEQLSEITSSRYG